MIKISFAGAGNVAWHLAKAYHTAGCDIVSVFSRNIQKAEELADTVKAKAVDNIKDIDINVDLIIISVKDSAVKSVVSTLPNTQAIVVHTAGGVGVEELSKCNNYGVLYPLQTFSKQSNLNIASVPFCIEANNFQNTSRLIEYVKYISKKVYLLNSEQRLKCHVAAVFANNFSNYMFTKAYEIIENDEISADILLPLIEETVNKLHRLKPKEAQTGPAIRGDADTINKHQKVLPDNLKNIYKMISDSIMTK